MLPHKPVGISFLCLLYHVECSTAVSSAYDGRHTHCPTAVVRAADGCRTMSISIICCKRYAVTYIRKLKNQCAALCINKAIRQLIAPSAAKKSIAGR